MIPIFVQKALRGEPLTIAGDGSQFRKFVYVEDLAEGNMLALKPIAANKIYNLDGSERVTIRQIAETVKQIVGDARIESTPARAGDFGGKEVSSELARQEGAVAFVIGIPLDLDGSAYAPGAPHPAEHPYPGAQGHRRGAPQGKPRELGCQS